MLCVFSVSLSLLFKDVRKKKQPEERVLEIEARKAPGEFLETAQAKRNIHPKNSAEVTQGLES